ncbi:hypothetical protein TBLA_0A05380 [Henningerozyma blattae CBS 6284]|uniref:D-isomer specific 2-hydroxyacid dehydrogenase NAD-binding domain-containing protein n=1 Tax=Henningerozyma blattae (strain ATCC 34711 / CBS 6284 / DSM 70876 / NBRC 10599 / NRRL Y-10934 / UCD 77-7) TaxID=1071380 RepID=I2GW29_HENB6|nr:hypothetical protein TBLA_0A05380 [Tetrapisispora blattae CBS 6284]CCH58331.1 hypothetical protein TBLA_0A05380 [Tetrapisispora blattae CBS 6284]
MSSAPVILRLGSIRYAQEAWANVEKKYNVLAIESDMTREKFLKELKEPNGRFSTIKVISRTYESIALTGRFDEEIANALPKSVKAVCHHGAGYDQIDVEPLRKLQIQVSHTPGAVDGPTATTHVFLLLGAMRNYSIGSHNLHHGLWPGNGSGATAPIGRDPSGTVVGIIGLGGIGRAIAQRLQPFGFKRIVYHNRERLDPKLEYGCEFVSFDELLKVSDVISISIPLNKSTHHMINKEVFEKMKDGVCLVNTARGAVINEADLIEALKSGKVRTAGLDVFEFEPEVPSELIKMPQVLDLPHMGTYTVEAVKGIEEKCICNVVSYLETGRVANLVFEEKDDDWVGK